jgi:tetratricopeptide (TPR) repeat protein
MAFQSLNRNQKKVLLGALAVVVLMGLFPPWLCTSQTQMYHEDRSWGLRGTDRTHAMGLPLFHEGFEGYHWLFNAPSGRFDYDQETSDSSYQTYKGTSHGYHIAWGILFFQWLLVSLAALALVHFYRDKPQVTPEPKTLTVAHQPKQGGNLCSRVSPEIITSKPEAEPRVRKDTISAKRDTDKTRDDASSTILAVFGSIAGLVILIAIGISLNPPKDNISAMSPADKASYTSGIAFMEKGDYQKAITDFNKLIELQPLDHAAYNNRGEAHLKLGNYQQAREDFNRAIIAFQKSSDWEKSSIGKIMAKHGLKVPEGYCIDESQYYRNRGLAYEKLGNKKQAIEDMKTAAKAGDKEAQKYLLSKEMDW